MNTKRNAKKLYEFRVHSIVEIAGMSLRVVRGMHYNGCKGCALWGSGECHCIACFSDERDDKRDIHFETF